MAMEPNSFTANVLAVKDLVESKTNKVSGGSGNQSEGALGESMDALDLPMTDKDLLKLRDEYENKYAPYYARIKDRFTKNKASYLGFNDDSVVLDTNTPGAANLQFEAEETFIPAALSRNPDPLVYCDNTQEGNDLAESVSIMLKYHADTLLLRRRLSLMVRDWSIYLLGVIKYGWDSELNDISIDNRKTKNFIFDPEGYVDVYGNFTSWLGERIAVTAERLIELFPKHKSDIELSVTSENGVVKLGTEVVYTEWWNDKYCFSTYRDIVLEKHKNEFFNYAEITQEVDDLGMPAVQYKKNHFAKPFKPYTFLSVFSLQQQPHDITSLLEQNIRNQKKISNRVEQIDQNVGQSNNGIAFSENNFNQETAKQAANALTRGVGKVLVPQGGPIGEAMIRLPAPSFPDAAFKELEMTEQHLRSSWGIEGLVSQPNTKDETARGMMLNQGRDTSRIGGGISDVIEQSVARSIFNWLVQLYMVFYDEPHFAAVLGVNKAVRYSQIINTDIKMPLVVTVAPNSMRPKDELTRSNQAVDLFSRGAIGPKTLLQVLDFPNPEESASDGALWSVDKAMYIQMNFPEMYQQLQQAAQQQQQMMMAQQGGGGVGRGGGGGGDTSAPTAQPATPAPSA